MRRICIVLVLFFSLFAYLYSEALGSFDFDISKHIDFKDNNLFEYFDYDISTEPIKAGEYFVESKYRCDYIYIYCKGSEKKRFLCLHNNEILILY